MRCYVKKVLPNVCRHDSKFSTHMAIGFLPFFLRRASSICGADDRQLSLNRKNWWAEKTCKRSVVTREKTLFLSGGIIVSLFRLHIFFFLWYREHNFHSCFLLSLVGAILCGWLEMTANSGLFCSLQVLFLLSGSIFVFWAPLENVSSHGGELVRWKMYFTCRPMH